MRQELLDRLVCAKYLYLLGAESLDRGGPYAAGQAVLTFQDAVELLLHTIAEIFHTPIKDQATFSHLLDEVARSAGKPLTHRAALLQLNRVRVDFKHHGLLPNEDNVKKFRRDLEGFFPNVLESMLGLSFDGLSLVSLIRNRRAANWLAQGESFIGSGNFDESIDATAVAFAVFLTANRHVLNDDDHSLESQIRSVGRRNEGLPETVRVLATELDKRFRDLGETLTLVSCGVDLNQYQRFKDLVPHVSLSMAGTIHRGHTSRPRTLDTHESAQFCSTFALTTMLKLQGVYSRYGPVLHYKSVPLRVLQSSPIVVWPDETPSEVIRTAEPGEILQSWGAPHSDMPGFVAISQDFECAFVPAANVKRIE
jgi:hypothetical protein